ncbi:MAG: hypothetical protein ACRD29_02920 [Acidimicrobiales bacterium]
MSERDGRPGFPGYPTYPGYGGQPACPPTPPLEPGPGTWPGPQDAGNPPPAWGYPPSSPKPGRARRIVSLSVVAVGVLGSTAFAVTSVIGTSGAASPEEAVQVFLEAIANEDAVGVLEALPAGERRVLGPAANEIATALQGRGLLGDDLSFESIGGVDITFDNVVLDVDEMADTVAVVRLTGGDVNIETIADDLPLADTVLDIVEEADLEIADASATLDLEDREAVLVAIDDGDGWHVSLSYTAAETARQAAGGEEPSFGAGVEPQGAESPAAAVEAFFAASAALDLEEVIARLNPGEAAALHDYAPLFLDDAQDALDEAQEGDDLQITIDEIDVETRAVDGGQRVDITNLVMNASSSSGDIEIRYDGECATYDGDDEVIDLLAGDDHELCTDDVEELGVVLGAVFNVQFHYVTVEHDGRFFVSPVRTLAAGFAQAIDALDDEVLEDVDGETLFAGEIAQRLEDFLEAAFEVFEEFEEFPGPEPGFDLPEAPPDGIFSGVPGRPVPPEGLGDEPVLQSAADRCFDGDFGSCDGLFQDSPAGSAYEEYAISCGGRRDSGLFGGPCTTDFGEFTPDAPDPATGLGDDPSLQPYADACFNGDMLACDTLYFEAELDSALEMYGSSCGGRMTQRVFGACLDALGVALPPPPNALPPPAPPAGVVVDPPQPAAGLGDDLTFQPFADACAAGSMIACDALFLNANINSPYESYGGSCGGRLAEPAFGCEELIGPRAPN